MKTSGQTPREKSDQPLPPAPSRRGMVLPAIFVFLWPAIYLYCNIIPFHGTYTAISNDFEMLYYRYKVYLLACLAQNHLPLWSPSEAAGYPFFSNPFAQVFYPLNLLLIPYYSFAGSYTLWDHQIFTILGLCIFSLGLYLWLRLIIPNPRAVLLGVLIMSVSFKMTEMLRFPNAVHTAAWYPWILYAMTKLFLCKTGKQTFLNSLLFVFSILCLCTAGYPYYIYYSVFLFPAYLCICLLPFLRQKFFGKIEFNVKQGIISIASAGFIAVCMCAPYLLAIAGLMSQTVDRGGKNFAYSTSHVFNIYDTLGSLIYPPFAQTEGWYFFSITALLIILIYILCILLSTQTRIPGAAKLSSAYSQLASPFAVFFLLGWIIIISYISYGKESLLFKLLWHFMPGFSSLRTWGRLNIILVPLIAWLCSLSYAFFENLMYGADSSSRTNRIWAIIVVTAGYTIILILQYYLYANNKIDSYWNHFPHLSGYQIYFIVFGFTGYLTLMLLLVLYRGFHRPAPKYLFPMFFLFLFSVIEMWPAGANTWVKKNQPIPQRIPLDISDINRRSFTTSRLVKRGLISLSPTFNAGVIPNWDFVHYNSFYKRFRNDRPSLDIVLGAEENPQKIFVSQSLKYSDIQAFLADSLRFRQTGQLISYNGDELVWELHMPIDGYFSFIDNWDSYWKAYVDNKEVPIELLFGTFKSVPLTQGKHRIVFRYEPTLKTVIFGTK